MYAHNLLTDHFTQILNTNNNCLIILQKYISQNVTRYKNVSCYYGRRLMTFCFLFFRFVIEKTKNKNQGKILFFVFSFQKRENKKQKSKKKFDVCFFFSE